MKVLLVSSGSGSRGGGEIFLDYLGSGLAERGHQVTLWMPKHPRMDELAEKAQRFGRVIRADYLNTYDRLTRPLSTCLNVTTSRRLASEWRALSPHIVHVNKQNLEDGLDLLRAARETDLPTVCTIHLTQTAVYLKAVQGRLRDWISRRALLRFPGEFVAVQEARRLGLQEFLGNIARTRTVFNGVPLVEAVGLKNIRELKRRELGLNDDDFLVLGLGRLVEQKRPFVFLEAARKLHRHFPKCKFLWVGDGNLACQWNEWVARENLQDVISCAGWQADALPFLLAGDMLLHVAEYEGLPLAIIEAMAAGLPCAVTRNFASEIPFFDESTVFFFDDPVECAARLIDRNALANISAAARQLIQNKLSLSAMIESYEKLYKETMNRDRPLR